RATIAQDATGRIKTGAAVTSTSLTMLVTARQDMAVDLQPSDWVLDRRGPVCLSVDGVETIPLAPAPSANSRVDTVWIMQRETQAPIGDNADGPLAGITTGVPGISPVAPALTDGQLAVADILIPSTATNTSSDGVVITQRAPYTTMQGGLLRFRSPTDLNLWKPVDGQRARLQDGTEYVGSGGVWVSQTQPAWVVCDTGNSYYKPQPGSGLQALSVRKRSGVVELMGRVAVGGTVQMYSDMGAMIPAAYRPTVLTMIQCDQTQWDTLKGPPWYVRPDGHIIWGPYKPNATDATFHGIWTA
ncbi:MAG: hypothetical protein L0K48_07510, partial [Bifidobacterium mongoliense]|nr:hypothetical protein [Bifidobacterium mongoliense]